MLNWEICHFMVKKGIVLGHHIPEKGIEVDRAYVEVIERTPLPISIKGMMRLLLHAFIYSRSSIIFQKLHILCASYLKKSVNFFL